MAQYMKATAVLCLVLGLWWKSNTVDTRIRTTQRGRLESKSGFAFEILERSDPLDKQPTSTVKSWVSPHAPGWYKNRSGSPLLHTHLYDDEHFEILQGTMGYVYEGKEGILEAGQQALLKAGKPHTWWNAAPDTELVQKFKIINTSGRHTLNERFFEQLASTAYDYGGLWNVPTLQLMVLFDYAKVEGASSWPFRLLVQNFAVPLGKLMGYKPVYPEYILP